MWCVAELDDEYVDRMEDVLAVYEKPVNPAEPVICLDEKPVSLHADVRPPIPAKPGKPAKQDNEYERHGTANVFAVVEPKAGRHFTEVTPNRSGAEFARVLGNLVGQYPFARTIHLVMDNLSTHTRKSLVDHFGEKEGGYVWNRFTLHYTPKHGSWLNQAEIELSLLSRQCLGSRRIPDLGVLRRQAEAWTREANSKRTTIHWRFTRRKARKTFSYEKPTRRRRLS
jgi:transposase